MQNPLIEWADNNLKRAEKAVSNLGKATSENTYPCSRCEKDTSGSLLTVYKDQEAALCPPCSSWADAQADLAYDAWKEDNPPNL